MLDAVALLGALAVVEAVERAHQIAGDAPDAVEGDAAQVVGQFHIFAVQMDVQPKQLFAVFLLAAFQIGGELRIGQFAARDIDRIVRVIHRDQTSHHAMRRPLPRCWRRVRLAISTASA